MTQQTFRRVAVASLIALLGLTHNFAAAQSRSAVAPRTGETTLLGVRLYDPVTVVISRYGNPSSVQPIMMADDTQPSGPTGPGGGQDFGGPPGAAGPSRGGDFGGPPGGAPLPNPGGPSPSPGGFGGGGGNDQRVTAQHTQYVYLRKGVTYTFIINDQGRVVQISAIGERDSGVRTRKGLTLGSTYKDVVRAYGYPESHEFLGNAIMTLKFLRRHHVAFQTFNQRVVGISVAAGTR